MSPVASVRQDAGYHDDLLDAPRLLGGINQLDGSDVVLIVLAIKENAQTHPKREARGRGREREETGGRG